LIPWSQARKKKRTRKLSIFQFAIKASKRMEECKRAQEALEAQAAQEAQVAKEVWEG
jgi:hypothetical protein